MNLEVFCNSINNKVSISYNNKIVSTLTWKIHDDCGDVGFEVKNANYLLMFYDGFYLLDHTAVIQFIMNIAIEIKNNVEAKDIMYLNSNREETKYPFFMPFTVTDEEIDNLPHSQLSLCNIWQAFQREFNGLICEDLLRFMPDDLKIGFFDLINVELTKKKEVSNNE